MSAPLIAGTEFAGFQIQRPLGAGGMGAVYLATDATLRRRIAVKVVAPSLAEDPRYRERFLREAELAAQLEHPAIVPIYAAGEHDGRLYIAMRYIAGGSLAERLAAGALEVGEAIRLLLPIAEALDAAHRAWLIHRDIKPGNVLLDSERAYLADFGLARSAADPDSIVTNPAALSGTLAYLAPEVIEGETATAASDQYALTCLLYECVTGRRPFDRTEAAALVYAHLSEMPVRASRARPGLPAAVDAVIARGLAKRPERRFGSCRELVERLAEASGLPASATRATPVRRRGTALIATGLVAAAVAGGALFAMRGRTSSPRAAATAASSTNPVFLFDAARRHPVVRLSAGPAPTDVAIGGGYGWVLNGGNHTVSRIDLVRKAVTGEPIGIGGTPLFITYGERAVWITTTRTTAPARGGAPIADSVVRIDPTTLTTDTIALPLPPGVGENDPSGGGIAAVAGAVWAIAGGGDVVRIDPVTRQPRRVTNGAQVWGVAGDAEGVWIVGDAHKLMRLDADTGHVMESISLTVGGEVGGPAVGGGSLWVPTKSPGAILRIDPATKAIKTIPAPPNLDWVMYADRRLWATSTLDGLMVVLDPATERISTMPVDGTPVSSAAGGGSVVVATSGVTCGPVRHARGVDPKLLVTSEFPLTGPDGAIGRPLEAAVRFVVADHDYRAGPFPIGYRACDYGTVNGGYSDPVCTAHARALAHDTRVVAVVGTLHSGCAYDEVPILAQAPGGPVAMVSPVNTQGGVTLMRRPNYARVIATEPQWSAAVIAFARRLGKRRVYMVGDNARFLRDNVDVPAARLGVQVFPAAPDWPHTDAAARRLARAIRRAGADVVVLDGAVQVDAGRTIRALRREFGTSVPLIAVDAFPVSELTRVAGRDNAVGIYDVTGTPIPASLPRRGRAWLTRFAASQPDGDVPPYVPLSAQATEVLLDAIARSDGTRTGVTRAVRQVRVTDGILPDFTFAPDGEVSPGRVSILQVVGDASSDAGLVSTAAFAGARPITTLTVPAFRDGLATAAGTRISITTAERMSDGTDCAETKTDPCRAVGTFRAADPTTRDILCPAGTATEDEWDAPDGGSYTYAFRTLRCPDGASVTAFVKRFFAGDVIPLQTSNIGESWMISRGNGRLARLRGDGTMVELWDHSHTPNTLGGLLTGIVRGARRSGS